MSKAWWKSSVIYQIYPRSFADSNGDGIGDLNGITAHLDYLKELGVDVIWLSPIYKSPNDDNGYDISDYQDIMTDFGTMEDFDRMIAEMHKRGIKLVMDLVVNHSSDEHRWFLESKKSKDNPYRDYYIWKDPKDGKEPNNWGACFGGSVWEFDEETGMYYLHCFSKKQPDLNQRVLSKFDLITVGETPGVTTEEAKKYANLDGSELNMVFQFEHMGTTDGKYGKWTTKKPEMKKVRAVMNKWQNDLEGKAWNSLYWDNHDQPRAVSRFGDDSPMYREVSAKMIATCLHMLKGSPYIYQGEEIGMTNAYFKSIDDYKDIEAINAYKEYTESGLMTEEEMLNCLKMVSRDNARTPMQWDDSANAGFTTGTPWISVNKNYTQINAKAALEDKDSVFYYYQKLIRLRHENEIIVEGVFHGLLEDNDDIYAYERTLGDEKLVAACNFTNKEVPCDLFEGKEGEELITNYKNHVAGVLQPYETRVILYK